MLVRERASEPVDESAGARPISCAGSMAGAWNLEERDFMLDPRIDKLADVLIHHSTKLQPGEKVLIESFDAPPEVVARLVQRVAQVGAIPLVETRQNQVL